MPISITNYIGKENISTGYILNEIYDLKLQICQLRNQVQADLDQNLNSPSIDTVALAQIMFQNITFSNILALSINNGLVIYKIPIESTTNVTTYGLIPTNCKLISLIAYSTIVLVGGTLSLALLLDSSNLTLYNGTNPSITEALINLENHYLRVLAFYKSNCEIPTILSDNKDVKITLPTNNCQFLIYNGCYWQNDFVNINSGVIKDTCVNPATLVDGDVLIWNALTQCWTNSSSGSGIVSADTQQITWPNINSNLSETLSVNGPYVKIVDPGFGYFQLTTNVPTGYTASYLLNWTGVVDLASGSTVLQMRITSNNPTINAAGLNNNTETELSLSNSDTGKLLAINYIVNNVPDSTTFYVQWRVIGSGGTRAPIIKSGTFIIFSVAIPPP